MKLAFVLISMIALAGCNLATGPDGGSNGGGGGNSGGEYALEAYFPMEPGHSLEYDFTNEKYGDGKRRITFQDPVNGLSRYLYSSVSNTPGKYYSYGTRILYGNDTNIAIPHEGTGSNDHLAYSFFLCVPKTVILHSKYKTNEIEYLFSEIVPFGSFPECLRIDFDSTNHTDTTLRGKGYFLLAKNTGLVYIFFKHTEDGRFGSAGKTFTYTLTDASRETAKKILKGKISSAQFPVLVALSGNTADNKFFSVETDNGDFSFSFYCKDGTSLAVVAGNDKDEKTAILNPYTYIVTNFSGPVHDVGTLTYSPPQP